MQKILFISVAVVATLFITLQENVGQAAVISQLDQLKDQFLPAEYKNTNFTLDEMKKIFREKCKKATGVHNSTLYSDIEKGAAGFVQCLSNFTNTTALQEEIEKARPIGELDTVFHKYCTKVPAAQKCFNTFNDIIQPCLSLEERKQNVIMMRVANNLLGFMCAKGGDQIALFVAEQGPECMEANKEAIGQCMNSSFSEYIPKNGKMPNLYDLPELVLAPKHCIDLERFEKCTLHHLQQCQEITPANVAESIFKFVKNETNCRGWIEDKPTQRSILKTERNAAAALQTISSSFVIVGSICVVLLKRVVEY